MEPEKKPARLVAYEPALAPPPFGLANTGVICYFNALLQALAGCTSLVRLASAGEARGAGGPAARELAAFLRAAGQAAGGQGPAPDPGASARVLWALVGELGGRHGRFGGGQESASEALVLLLERLPPAWGALFTSRWRLATPCPGCAAVARGEDYAVVASLFHFDALAPPPEDAAAFAAALARAASPTGAYRCEACGGVGDTERSSRLALAPEVLVCAFNAYGVGAPRRARFFPPAFALPGVKAALRYRLVAQVEHSGGLGGGHYWARAARGGDAPGVYLLNDSSAAPGAFAPSPETYLLFYHAEE